MVRRIVMVMFKRFLTKILVSAVLAVLIIAVLCIMLPLGKFFGARPPLKEIAIHTMVQQVMPSAEFVALHYKYTDLIEDKADNLRNIWGMRIPGTAKEVLVITDGVVKLGVNCEKIKIDATGSNTQTTIVVTFPPVKIISHEFDIRRIRDLSGLFVRSRLEDFPDVIKVYKSKAESKVMENQDLFLQARASTESFFKQLFQAVPALESTNIEYSWEPEFF